MSAFSQEKDTVFADIQTFKINQNLIYSFKKPTIGQLVKYVPDDLYQFGKDLIKKENLKWDALALGTTLATIPYDQKILDDAGLLGEKIGGWDGPARYKRVAGLELLPTSISSGVYYLGNGNTTLLLSGAFYLYGKIGKDDYRALNTSSELVETLISVGIPIQIIKRVTGRQSPFAAIDAGIAGGDWNPFPSFSAYGSNTPNYDAMPSGHLATYMATVTVISTNYPEYKWIKPVGYSLGTLLAYNMVSTKVHWTSDYPIAILMGYFIGKNIANRRIIKIDKSTGVLIPKKYKIDYNFSNSNKTNLFGATITF